MDTPQHTYPPDYGPGSSWALDEAWAILDTFTPGTLPDDTRCWLAGRITGMLLRLAREGRLQPPSRARAPQAVPEGTGRET